MGDSPKWVKSKKGREKKERLNNGENNGQATHGAIKPPGPKEKEERLNIGDNNGQAMHGARKHAWRTQAAWANFSSYLLNGKVATNNNSCLSFYFSSRVQLAVSIHLLYIWKSEKKAIKKTCKLARSAAKCNGVKEIQNMWDNNQS